jgi:HEAT repeat protein
MAEALARVLDPKFSKVTRCLALDLISITGDDPVVPNVAQMLKDADPDVRDEARRSLEGIPGKASLAALIDAAGKTEGKLKLAVLTSLGQRAAPEAADVLVAATESSDTEVVLAALESLARLGLPKDDRVRLPSWDGLSSSQQVRLANALLRWAELRAAKGAPEDALEIYGAVAQRTESEHLTCAALNGAAKAAPAEVFPYLVSALGRDENTVRMTAVHLLEKQPGDDAQIKALLEAYASAKAETREVILRVLKNWNGKKRGT